MIAPPLNHEPAHKSAGFWTTFRFTLLGLILGFILQPVLCSANLPTGYWTYTITDLGDLGGGTAVAYAINSIGQVVGYSSVPGGANHAFLYSGGQMRDLGTLPGMWNSVATEVNDAGEVVGYAGPIFFDKFSSSGPVYSHSFLYSGGGLADLTYLVAQGHFSAAVGINNSGWIVGDVITDIHPGPYFNAQPFLYNGQAQFVGPNEGSIIYGINNLGQIVGSSFFGAPYVYSNGQTSYFNIPPSSFGFSGGFAINNSGAVVGRYGVDPVTRSWHAFLYNNGASQDLGTLGGHNSYAYGINDSGEVVGEADTASGAQRAFLYGRFYFSYRGVSGYYYALEDLNSVVSDPLWELQTAYGINNAGQIVGYGLHFGQVRAFLLTPVFHPYPSGLGR